MFRPNAMYLDEERCNHCELCHLIAPVIRDNPQRIPITSATLEAMATCPSGTIQWLEGKGEGMYQLDVRPLAPRERHALIFETFDALAPGEAFELLNDHNPKPLYSQLQAARSGQLSWEYLEEGPEVWRVRIGKV